MSRNQRSWLISTLPTKIVATSPLSPYIERHSGGRVPFAPPIFRVIARTSRARRDPLSVKSSHGRPGWEDANEENHRGGGVPGPAGCLRAAEVHQRGSAQVQRARGLHEPGSEEAAAGSGGGKGHSSGGARG